MLMCNWNQAAFFCYRDDRVENVSCFSCLKAAEGNRQRHTLCLSLDVHTAVAHAESKVLLASCSGDISQGVRSSAAAVTAAEQGVRQGAQYLDVAVKDAIIPSVKSRVQPAKGEAFGLCTV